MPEMQLPPGAVLVPDDQNTMALPPGAKLVSNGPPATATPSADDVPAPKLAPMPNVPGLTPAPAKGPGILDKVLNSHTGNNWADVVPGVVQGAGKGLISTAYGARDLADKVPGVHSLLNAAYSAAGISPEEQAAKEAEIQQARPGLTVPKGIGQGTGKFLEQSAEFALPATKISTALKGASLLPRALAQAGVGGTVSAAQSGGDPTATGTGVVLGGAGELAGAAVGGVKKLLAAKAPNLTNFAESFGGATPLQKAKITNSLEMLTKDGVVPPGDVREMAGIVKGKLADLGTQYQNLDPAIKSRIANPNDVINNLSTLQKESTLRGVITDETAHSTIQGQIDKIKQVAAANGGNLNLDDLIHMKLKANGRTTFESPEQEQSLWEHIGDAYRAAADKVAPETTPLNNDYARYKELEKLAAQNIARGKGVAPTGLDLLSSKNAGHMVGTAVGAGFGSLFGPVGAGAGGLIGGVAGPKIAKTGIQLIQNLVDSGTPAGELVKQIAHAGPYLKIPAGAAVQETARRVTDKKK